ncbi:MAG: DUF2971 domain-containing protein [Armatimonadetes bacterium]|nr:DUF2971 domain-containing protein [Armatimonadota bacterium]
MTVEARIYDLLKRSRDGRRNPDGKLIYHYTSAQGARGILASGSFWMFDARQMQDDHELVMGNRKIKEALAEAANNTAAGSPLEVLAQKLIPILDMQEQEGLTYIGCFTEEPDNLAAWDKFADHGRGFCLAIPWTQIASPYWAPGMNPVIRKVEYDQIEQQAIVDAVVNLLAAKAGFSPATCADQIRLLATESMVCWKREDYKDEKEWRILRFRQDRPQDGERNGRLYLTLDSATPLPITKVYAGAWTSSDDRAMVEATLKSNPAYSGLTVS